MRCDPPNLIRRSVLSFLILFFLLICPTAAAALLDDVYVAPAPVGDDANSGAMGDPVATINTAIGLANIGGTIHLADGAYNENVVINKDEITLTGESGDSSAVVIDATGTGSLPILVDLYADTITIENLTVQNAEGSDDSTNGGIVVRNGTGLRIQNVTTQNNIKFGISLLFCSDAVLINNTIHSNPSRGISLYRSTDIAISENVFTDNSSAVFLYRASDIRILKNIFTGNATGVWIGSAEGDLPFENIMVRQNLLYQNNYGIYICTPMHNLFIYQNDILESTSQGVNIVGTGSATEIRYNNILDSTYNAIRLLDESHLSDARYNYYGTTDGSVIGSSEMEGAVASDSWVPYSFHPINTEGDTSFPESPSSITTVSGPSGITLSWSAPTHLASGAAIPGDSQITYNVYRLMKDFNHYYNFPPDRALPEKINSVPITTTSYLDNDLWVAGTQYHYMVTAVVAGNESGVQDDPTSAISQMNPVNGNGQVIPNDPDFPKQWHLHNTGQTLTLGDESTINCIEDLDIDAPEAWAVETGDSSVIIAIMGRELVENQMDLGPQFWINPDEIPHNSIDDDANDWVDDYTGYPAGRGYSGHELSCAASAGAAPNDSWGVIGVAPDCRIMSLPNISTHGVNFATYRGVRVFSESYNYYGIGINKTLGPFGIQNRLHDSGGVYFSATSFWTSDSTRIGMTARSISANWTGWMGSSVSNPFELPMPVCVGAINVWLPSWTEEDGYNAYGYISGLSYGIPQLAGVAGLICSHYPEAITTPEFIYETIMLASEDITTTGVGVDNVSGFGMLNAAHALKVFDGDILGRFDVTLGHIADDRYQLRVAALTDGGDTVEGMTYAKITAHGENAVIQSANNNVIGPFNEGLWSGEVTLNWNMGDTVEVSFADISAVLTLPYSGPLHVLFTTTPGRDTGTLGGITLTLKETTGGTTYVTHSTTAGTAVFDGVAGGVYDLQADDTSTLNRVVTGINFPATGSAETNPVVLPALVPGDANNDNGINDFDRSIVAGAYGSAPPTDPRADINRDGVVNDDDLTAVENRFGLSGESLP